MGDLLILKTNHLRETETSERKENAVTISGLTILFNVVGKSSQFNCICIAPFTSFTKAGKLNGK